MSTLQGSGGSWLRNAELSSLCARLLPSRLKSVNGHRDQAGFGEAPSCPRFCVASCPRVSKVSPVIGIGAPNCRRFWPRLLSSRLTSVNGHRDRGVLACCLGSQKCQRSQGSGGPGREMPNCRRFALAGCPRVSKMSTVAGMAGGCGHETQNCLHFWKFVTGGRGKVFKGGLEGGPTDDVRRGLSRTTE